MKKLIGHYVYTFFNYLMRYTNECCCIRKRNFNVQSVLRTKRRLNMRLISFETVLYITVSQQTIVI